MGPASIKATFERQAHRSALFAMKTLGATLCTLEPQITAHAAEMFAVLSDPAIYEFENEPPQNEAWLATRFERLESRASGDGTQQWLNWVIRLPDAKLAGYVQATVLSDGTSYVAYELSSRYWRQGIGSSALQSMLAHLQQEYGVNNFVAVLKAKNYRSEGLLRKLGFLPASAEQQAQHQDEADELVMVKPALGSGDTA